MIAVRTRKRDGRRVYDVRLRSLVDGRVYTRTFATKREAQDYEAAERTARNRGGWIDPRAASTSLDALAAAWLASNPAKRARTLERDRQIVRAAVDTLGATRTVGSVTRADVQRLVDAWRVDHAPSTVRRMFSAVRAAFSYAESAELIVKSPCHGIKLPPVGLVDRPMLAGDQLAAVADELGEQHGLMVWLGTVLGLRWGEAAGLRVGSLDLLRGTVAVSAQLGRDRQLSAPKSAAGRRSLAAPRWLLDDLAALLARRGLTAADADELVFVNDSGGPLNYTAWRRTRWAPACERAGVPGLRFHDLRSMAATALVAEGVDIKTAQTRLGHSNPALTLAVYARATVEADRRAADAVGDRFRPRDGRAMDAPARTPGSRR